MKQKLPRLVLLFLLFLFTKELYSQELNAIQTVVPFLTIAPDSRAGGMGDAGVATSPDVYSNHWNPAKYAFIDGNGGVGISYSPWLRNLVPDINIAYLSGYYRIDRKQVASASLLYSSLGDVPFTDDYGNLERTFKPNELAFDLGYSRIFADHFSGGIAFRFIYSNLTGGAYSGGTATRPGISFAADIGGYYHNDISLFSKDGEIGLGFNFSNIGSKMSYSDGQASDFIPMNFRIGASGTINFDNYNKFTLALDLNKLLVPTPQDSIDETNVSVPLAIFQSFYDAPGGFSEELHEITYSLGAEYWYNNQFAIRGGYFHEHESKGNRKYFTAGAGFRLKGFTIDFSYLMPTVANHPLARTLRFSLSFDSNSFRKAGISE
ncbi:MAG: type IX secretion system outer membrane channel protein PorV [Bacteroidales bacterium]|nr:type IX secretion system outer membrane channel protein PorV [Bacteroidales bacterium]